MNNHLSDADLVAIALLPDDASEAQIHLAACTSCGARMDRALTELDRHRAIHDSSVDSRDATFWKRQELSIMRRVSRSGNRTATRRSLIAAAIVAVAVGGFWFGRTSVNAPPNRAESPAITVAQSLPYAQGQLVPEPVVSTNPWETDSLSEFQPVVDWESWVEDDGKEEGTI